jgi:hypothetical protein
VYVLKYFRIRCLLTAMVNRNSSAPGGRPSLAAQSFSAMMISSLLTVFLLVGLIPAPLWRVNGQNQKVGVVQASELFCVFLT